MKKEIYVVVSLNVDLHVKDQNKNVMYRAEPVLNECNLCCWVSCSSA